MREKKNNFKKVQNSPTCPTASHPNRCFQDWGTVCVSPHTRPKLQPRLRSLSSCILPLQAAAKVAFFVCFLFLFFFKCLGDGAADGRISPLTLYGVFQKNKVNTSRDGRAAIMDYLSAGCEAAAAAAETTERRRAEGASSR